MEEHDALWRTPGATWSQTGKEVNTTEINALSTNVLRGARVTNDLVLGLAKIQTMKRAVGRWRRCLAVLATTSSWLSYPWLKLQDARYLNAPFMEAAIGIHSEYM